MATEKEESTIALNIPHVTLTPSSLSVHSAAEPVLMQQPITRGNPEGPDHHFQVFQKSLLEHEFVNHDAFVSARVQRIQHGIYFNPDKLQFYGMTSPEMKITFVAVTFTFHPMYSLKHRFQRAIINIQASDDKQHGLRIVKFAPHIAYGRISTETLHWNFSLSSTIGVTQPFTASVTPSTSFDRQKVIDAMLKIQGSAITNNGLESSKLVWSLEENQQQAAGLPREFTFIFLVERMDPDAALRLAVTIKPVFSKDVGNDFLPHEPIGGQWVNLGTHEMGQRFSTTPFNFATMMGQFEDLIELPGNAVKLAVRA
jgi:hypothetical protein